MIHFIETLSKQTGGRLGVSQATLTRIIPVGGS